MPLQQRHLNLLAAFARFIQPLLLGWSGGMGRGQSRYCPLSLLAIKHSYSKISPHS